MNLHAVVSDPCTSAAPVYVACLIACGSVCMMQVDEPGFREGLPLQGQKRSDYLQVPNLKSIIHLHTYTRYAIRIHPPQWSTRF